MKELMLLTFLLICLRSVSQPDSLKYKNVPERVMQQGKKMYFEGNTTEQKAREDYKIIEVNKSANFLMQTPQKAQEFLQFKKDDAETLKAAFSKIKDPEEETSNTQTAGKIKGPDQFDSRIELRQLDPLVDWQLRILRNAGSVALVVRKEDLHPLTDSLMRLGIGQTLGEKYKLCPGQAFAKQPVIGEGTAFIIDSSTMITAAHVFEDSPSKYAIVFGYELVNKIGSYETDIVITNIFYPTSIIFKDDNLDVAVFSTDRAMSRLALPLSKQPVQRLDRVYAIGYPSGLPEKISINASVQTNDQLQYFYTTLDAFQGNSGSPVFSLVTHEVIGILVSGETDYKFNGNCNEVTLCSIPYCKGEKVIRISELIKAME